MDIEYIDIGILVIIKIYSTFQWSEYKFDGSGYKSGGSKNDLNLPKLNY